MSVARQLSKIACAVRVRVGDLMSAADGRVDPYTASILELTRWVAALLVVIYHARVSLFPEWGTIAPEERTLLLGLFYQASDLGHQAVMWFFVSSGFLVGGNVVAEIRKGQFDFRRYLLNRGARLYVVLVPALMFGLLLDHVRVRTFGIGGGGFETEVSYAVSTIIANGFFLQTLLTPTAGTNLPLWSLAYEAWYYALFPLMLAPSWARGKALILALLAVAGMLTFLSLFNIGILTSFSVWLLGVAVRVVRFRVLRSQVLTWGAAVGAAVAYPELISVIGGAPARLLVAVTFALALLASRGARRAAPLMGARFHRKAAATSFSLYAVHQPVLYFAAAFWSGRGEGALNLAPNAAGTFVFFGGLVTLLLVVGWAFSTLFESRTEVVRTAVLRLPEFLSRLRQEGIGVLLEGGHGAPKLLLALIGRGRAVRRSGALAVVPTMNLVAIPSEGRADGLRVGEVPGSVTGERAGATDCSAPRVTTEA
jgi:peptidoglycan/LPS O-acetylase OafA/YrhL